MLSRSDWWGRLSRRSARCLSPAAEAKALKCTRRTINKNVLAMRPIPCYWVPRVAPATLGAGAGGGAPPSSSPSHFTEHDTYDQELGRPMRVKGCTEKYKNRQRDSDRSQHQKHQAKLRSAQHTRRERPRGSSTFFFSTLGEGVGVPSRARLPAYRFPPNTHHTLSTKLAIVTTAGH